MRTNWLLAEIDYICFAGSVAWVLLAVVCWWLSRSRTSRPLAWPWLGWFGLLYGVTEWLDLLAQPPSVSPWLGLVQTGMMSLAFSALFEFGRRSGRSRAAICWLPGLLVVSVFWGWRVGVPGLNACCRLALGLPGGLWAAWTLWRTARQFSGAGGGSLRATALALLVATAALGAVVPTADFWPASRWNQDLFLAAYGLPVQCLRALCAWLCLAGMWWHERTATPRVTEEGRSASWVLPLAIPLLVALGWVGTAWRGRVAQDEMRQTVLRQAQSLAQAIPQEWVRQLSFTASDRTNPAFLRLRQAMIAYGKYLGLSNVYTMAVRGRQIVFGPENLDASDALASPPGTVYEQPRFEDWEVFRSGQPAFFGPFTDEYGSFVNGLAPVLDPSSGHVLLVVGIDIPIAQWQDRLAAARRMAMGVALFAIVMLVGGAGMLQYRRLIPAERRAWWWRHAETLLTAALGLTLTGILSLVILDAEQRSQREDFLRLANAKAELVRDAIGTIGERLGSVARFFEGSSDVTAHEFETFTGPLVRLTPVGTMEWLPFVAADEKERFEAERRRAGHADFGLKERSPRGEIVPAAGRTEYYPVGFVSPLPGHEAVLGFDRAADASQRVALRQAAETGFGTAALTRASLEDSLESLRLVLFEPVFPPGGVRPRGFVACELAPQTLLEHTLAFIGQDGAMSDTLIQELTLGSERSRLADYPAQPSPALVDVEAAVGEGTEYSVHPVLVCDRTWAVVQRPRLTFQQTHRMWQHQALAVMGGLVTLLVTAFIGTLRRQQTNLEERVRERTRELEAERDLFMGGPTVVFLWRNAADWPVEYVSANVAQVLGYESRQLTDGSLLFPALVHPDEWQAVSGDMREHIARQAPWFERELRLLHSSGEYRWFHDFTVLRRDARGEVTHYHGYLQDVTERKLAEAWLARRDAILAAAQFAGAQFLRGRAWEATVPDVLAKVGRAADVSRVYVFERHIGPDGEQLTSQRYEWVAAGIEPQADNPGLQNVPCESPGFARWSASLARGEPICGLVRDMPPAEREALEPQGIFSLVAMPIRAAGQWWGFIGFDDCQRPRQWRQAELDALRVVADMLGAALERKQAEDALRASEERFRAAVESAPAGIFVAAEGWFAYVNDLGARLLGADAPATLIGTAVLERVHADCLPSVRERLRVVVEESRPVPAAEENWVRLDGGLLEAEWSAVPFRYEGQQAALVFFRDIAGRKRQEEMQIRSQKLESLGTLAGGIAHDFNNLLYAISGNTELSQLDLPSDHPVQGNLSEVAKACARASELVRRILTFSRPHEPARQVVAVPLVVEEAVTLLRRTLPAMIDLRTRFAPGLPPILADATQLHQIIINLATNAAHAIGRSSGWIEFRLDVAQVTEESAQAVADVPPGRYVRLVVADNGCGMNRATLKRIFDPFFTTKPSGQGTGLGLSVVHGIVKSHRGGIAVDSQPGSGSTFYLYFPVVDKPPLELAADRHGALQRPVVPGRGVRILYVDDEEALVFLATRMLQRLGHAVAGYTDAIQALQEFRSRSGDFDVIVTDLAMPKMSGFDFAREVLAFCPGMPIIMTSGYVRSEDQEAAQRMGIREVILKPTTIEELVPLLDRLVGSALSSDGTAPNPA